MSLRRNPRRSRRIRPRSLALVAVVMTAAGLMAAPGVAAAAPSTGSDPGSVRDYLDLIPKVIDQLPPGLLEELDLGSLDGEPPAVQRCNEETRSGGRGVTETRYILGRTGPTAFTLKYETYDQPDKIQVYYQGRVIADTGLVGDNINQGTGSIRVGVPAGLQNFVTVKVTGPEQGTLWDYTVFCP